MCEARLAEPCDVRVAPVVLGVAALAFTGAGRRQTSVVAGLATDVLRYVLVTVETQLGLPLAIGPIVAIGTIPFDFRVRLRDGAGHDQLLDARGPDLAR